MNFLGGKVPYQGASTSLAVLVSENDYSSECNVGTFCPDQPGRSLLLVRLTVLVLMPRLKLEKSAPTKLEARHDRNHQNFASTWK